MIKLNKDYSDYTDTTDLAYPAGKAVDATTEESIDGTPYLKKWMNNIHGAFTALWVKAFGSVDGMSGKPDSVDHSDVLLAVEKLIERPLSLHSDTRGANAHGATSTATEGQIVTRDQAGRAKVVAPVEADDIARKEEVDAEAEARTSGDNALSGRITAEATARLNADNALQHNINLANNARTSADTHLQNQLNALGLDLLKPGDIVASPLSSRAGCLPCSGGAVSRTAYASLYQAIGGTYGWGDGHSTFNVPPFNANGAFLRGKGGNAGAVGVTPQSDAIRNITGSFQGRRIPSSYYGSGALYRYETSYKEDSVVGTGHAFTNQIGFDASRSVGTDHIATENRPVNHAIYWHIKY